MNHRTQAFRMALATVPLLGSSVLAQNQTGDLSPMIQGETPFNVTIEKVDWKSDPLGTVHSAAVGKYLNKGVIVGGMSTGMHEGHGLVSGILVIHDLLPSTT